jgi:hypothetical protein
MARLEVRYVCPPSQTPDTWRMTDGVHRMGAAANKPLLNTSDIVRSHAGR